MPRLPTPLLPLWPQVKRAYTCYTRLVSPVSRRLAGLSHHGGPRAVAPRLEDVSAANGVPVQWWVVHEPESIKRPVPDGDPPADHRFAAAQVAEVPRAAIALLPRARVDGRFGGVITHDHRLLYEFSQYFGISTPVEHPQFLRPFRSAPRNYDGVVAVLGDRGDDNYYHFIVDILPKLSMLADCPDLPRPDAYYVPTNRRFQRDLLQRAGLDLGRVIDSRESPYLRASQLLAVGLPDAHLQTPRWAVDWLRSTLLQGAGGGRARRLYLTRGSRPNTRIVRNEDEVVAALEPLGFEVFDAGGHSVTEQISAFADAEVVVAPHGASLANLVFTTRPTRVIEMFPPDYVNPCYWTLSYQLPHIDYHYLLGVGRVPAGDPQAVASDITVDITRLRRVLDG